MHVGGRLCTCVGILLTGWGQVWDQFGTGLGICLRPVSDEFGIGLRPVWDQFGNGLGTALEPVWGLV